MAAQALTTVDKARADDGTYTCFFYGKRAMLYKRDLNMNILRRHSNERGHSATRYRPNDQDSALSRGRSACACTLML